MVSRPHLNIGPKILNPVNTLTSLTHSLILFPAPLSITSRYSSTIMDACPLECWKDLAHWPSPNPWASPAKIAQGLESPTLTSCGSLPSWQNTPSPRNIGIQDLRLWIRKRQAHVPKPSNVHLDVGTPWFLLALQIKKMGIGPGNTCQMLAAQTPNLGTGRSCNALQQIIMLMQDLCKRPYQIW